ncbi:MAG: SpoIIE family protein phosphatase [Balneola sp.]
MFSESNNHFRDLLLLLLGCLGAFWFYFSYLSLDPVSIIKNEISEEAVISKSDSVVNSWQVYQGNTLPKLEMQSYRGIVDSLQHKLGKNGFRELMKNEETKDFPLFYWRINNFFKDSYYEDRQRASEVKSTPNGEIISYSMDSEAIKKIQPFNNSIIRQALGLNFETNVENRIIQDSLLNELLNFQTVQGETYKNYSNILKFSEMLGATLPDNGELFERDEIWNGATAYLNDTYWKRYSFQKDSVEFQQDQGLRYVRLFVTAKDSVLGFFPKLEIDLLPAGGIKAITFNFNDLDIPSRPYFNVMGLIIQFTLLCLGIWLISVFYLRIKAKAIDTQPAFVISVLAGFMFSATQFLRFATDLELNSEGIQNISLPDRFFIIGILGAISAVVFFVITTISDSVTRQHWPEKLKAWDLARRGFFKNKPVGRSFIQAICIAGMLAGLWTILVQILPETHITGDVRLQSPEFAFPSIAVLIENLLASIVLVITILMILGNQLYAITKIKWIIPVLSGFIFALLLDPFISMTVHPFNVSLIINFIIGASFGLFYLRYGFLTMVISLFIYTGIFTTRAGWALSNSPDANLFYVFITAVSGLFILGFYFVTAGSEKKDLPDYVPGYIEDQAKEQRLDQELEIAQEVQRTFLPSRVEKLTGIDIAGICEPAQETGGDYYDMISLGKNRMAIAIGDVSGKGIQAAFYMTFVKGVLHSLSALILSPLELLNQLNRLFKENATRGTFVSMIYGILEADKRELTFARAGHNPMLVVRANGDVEWLMSKGIGIGVTNSLLFMKGTEEFTLKLKEGDVAVLYTDGITEMMNISNQFYGEERLEKVVKGVRKGASSSILNIIISDVKEFKGVAKQHDDMTLVVIKADASVNK